MKNENPQARVERCQQEVEQHPDSPAAHYNLGLAYTQSGRVKKAEQAYRKALELDPSSGISHYLQALCWSVRSAEEGLDEATSSQYKQKALDELEKSFNFAFKGYERIRNEKGFDHIRDMKEFKELMRGK